MNNKILIADRSEDIRRGVKHLLSDFYNDPVIYETESIFDAMRIAKLYSPDVIFTNLDLAYGCGLELLILLRRANSHGIRIVFSNYISYDLEFLCGRLGADLFISKKRDLVKIKSLLGANNEHKSNTYTYK
jgi:DNA-binding NarL/FixJ family response regulator